jgi:hypothetical protein
LRVDQVRISKAEAGEKRRRQCEFYEGPMPEACGRREQALN